MEKIRPEPDITTSDPSPSIFSRAQPDHRNVHITYLPIPKLQHEHDDIIEILTAQTQFPSLMSRTPSSVLVRGVVVLFICGLTFFLASKILDSTENLNDVKYSQDSKVKKPTCGMQTPCPADQFSFKIISGAANVVGPTLCFNDKILMSGILNNIGKGLNIAVVNASSGNLLRSDFFDMWTGNIKLLLDFLNQIKLGNIVLLASFDDPATKMTDEAKTLFSELGSSLVHNVQFRDNWVFVGAKPIKEKSPFEQIMKNDNAKNKYGNWPEAVDLEGCIPRKLD